MEIRKYQHSSAIVSTLMTVLSFVTPLLIIGCGEEVIDIRKEELVVEGYIADGEFPVVFVTSTLPITEDSKEFQFKEYVAQWARVGITTEDGKMIYLTARYDSHYFPPYVFTTTAIRGQAGKKYHLTVDWRKMHGEATATIPTSVPIDAIWCHPCQDSDTLRQVSLCFQDNSESHDYYLLQSRRNEEPMNPQLCLFGIIDDVTLSNSEVTTSIRRGGLITEIKEYTPYYAVGDDVDVWLMHVDSLTYHYWYGVSNSKQLGRSLLFNVTTPLDGNIHGGHGIWYGCGLGQKNIKVD